MNARCTPAWIRGTHGLDPVLDIRRHRRSSVTNPALPFPIQPKALAVSSDDGLGFHNAQRGAPIRPNSGEPDPDKSVARSQSQATVSVHALQQKKLMTECQVLSMQSGPSLKAAAKGEEQGSEKSREARRAGKRGVRTFHCTLPRLATSSTLSIERTAWVRTPTARRAILDSKSKPLHEFARTIWA